MAGIDDWRFSDDARRFDWDSHENSPVRLTWTPVCRIPIGSEDGLHRECECGRHENSPAKFAALDASLQNSDRLLKMVFIVAPYRLGIAAVNQLLASSGRRARAMSNILPFPSRNREMEPHDDGPRAGDPDTRWDKVQRGIRELLALREKAKLEIEHAIAALEENYEKTREGAQIAEDPSTRTKLQNNLDFLEQLRAKLGTAV